MRAASTRSARITIRKLPSALAGEEALDPPARLEELLNDGRREMAPAQHDHVVAERDWSHARLEPRDELVHPLREDRNEQTEEEDVAQHRDHRGDGASREPLVIAQVARIREPQKCPPDSVARLRESRVQKRDEDSREQGDERHDRRREEQAMPEASQQEALEREADPFGRPMPRLASSFDRRIHTAHSSTAVGNEWILPTQLLRAPVADSLPA